MRGDHHQLRLQVTPHVFESIEIYRATEGAIALRQDEGDLLAMETFLRQNRGQDALTVVVGLDINDADICAAGIAGAEKFCAVTLSHNDTLLSL